MPDTQARITPGDLVRIYGLPPSVKHYFKGHICFICSEKDPNGSISVIEVTKYERKGVDRTEIVQIPARCIKTFNGNLHVEMIRDYIRKLTCHADKTRLTNIELSVTMLQAAIRSKILRSHEKSVVLLRLKLVGILSMTERHEETAQVAGKALETLPHNFRMYEFKLYHAQVKALLNCGKVLDALQRANELVERVDLTQQQISTTKYLVLRIISLITGGGGEKLDEAFNLLLKVDRTSIFSLYALWSIAVQLCCAKDFQKGVELFSEVLENSAILQDHLIYKLRLVRYYAQLHLNGNTYGLNTSEMLEDPWMDLFMTNNYGL